MTNTIPKPFVFVLMPFLPEFDDVYKLGIKQACVDAGAYCERVDEQIFQESILDRIYNQIAKADIVVADMTGRNPNVFYETGYAHALGKRVILLTQKSDDIPFDLKHYPHIVYEGRIVDLKDELSRRVEWYIQNPGRATTTITPELKYHMLGIELADGAIVEVKDRWRKLSFRILCNLDIQNPSDHTIYNSRCEVSFEYPRVFGSVKGYPIVSLPDNSKLVLLGEIEKVLPMAWTTKPIEFECLDDPIKESHLFEVCLRIHTEIMMKEISFQMKFV